MASLTTKIRTAWALGPSSIAQAIGYRAAMRAGVHPVQRLPDHTLQVGPFYRAATHTIKATAADLADDWTDQALLFGAHRVALGVDPPDWLTNPLSGQRIEQSNQSWWRVSAASGADGDIKPVWELSRMGWAVCFARRAALGDEASLQRLNAWLADWARINPPYRGPNWGCGQETAIRVLHLGMAAVILGQEKQSCPDLLCLVDTHLRRIAPTTGYAAAQKNNHIISEAAGLFVGGAWLATNRAGGVSWRERGRRELEAQVARLIAPDGGFSLYSVNYQRSVVDTLAMVEVARRALGEPAFSPAYIEKARAATEWLAAFVDPVTGDAPNLGANDGSRLLPLTPTAFRDYRPTVQLASALFGGVQRYGEGPHDAALRWLGVGLPDIVQRRAGSALFPDTGFATIHRGRAAAYARFPRFRFRPSQADALHVDFWLDGRPVLKDGGTYSYNADPESIDYFGGVRSHNTIQFDGGDQMPRLGRFLLGDWTHAHGVEWSGSADTPFFQAAYRDRAGRTHERHVELSAGLFRVIDRIHGFRDKAVLRWRLAPGSWTLDGNFVRGDAGALTITGVDGVALATGHESLHYLEKTELPVVEATVTRPGQIISEFRFSP